MLALLVGLHEDLVQLLANGDWLALVTDPFLLLVEVSGFIRKGRDYIHQVL